MTWCLKTQVYCSTSISSIPHLPYKLLDTFISEIYQPRPARHFLAKRALSRFLINEGGIVQALLLPLRNGLKNSTIRLDQPVPQKMIRQLRKIAVDLSDQ
jgi:hypothetical protein